MKPLTKTTVNRGGGLAGQLIPAGQAKPEVKPQPELVVALKSLLEPRAGKQGAFVAKDASHDKGATALQTEPAPAEPEQSGVDGSIPSRSTTNRMKDWRSKNRERNNAYMRDYQRKRRAAEKADK